MKTFLKKMTENKNTFIFVCVCFLTIVTIGVSYSAFFTVKSGSSEQTVTTGTLAVSYTNVADPLSYAQMIPLSDEEGLNQSDNRLIYIQNTGDIDASYVLTIGYDQNSFKARDDYSPNNELTPIEYVKFAIYDYDSLTETSTLVAGPLSIADLPIYEIDTNDPNNNRYSILFGKLGDMQSGQATKTYKIKTWLADTATPIASNTYFFIDTKIIAIPEESRMNYSFKGALKDQNSNVINNAILSLQNGSVVTETDNLGNFDFGYVPIGTYNLDIDINGQVYKGNITFKESETYSLVNLSNDINLSTKTDIYNFVYTYATTPLKVIESNLLSEITSAITLKSNIPYKMKPTYLVNGGLNNDISNLNITIDMPNFTFMVSN